MDDEWVDPVNVQSYNDKLDVSGVLDYMADSGSLGLVVGPPKRGKTSIMTALAEVFYERGKHIGTNLPIVTRLPRLHIVHGIREMTRVGANRKKGEEFVYLIDEAAMRFGGLSPSEGRENVKWWTMNVMRKVTGGSIFIALQNETMGAPLFRQSEVLRSVIRKIHRKTALIEFPNLDEREPFPISRSALPLKVDLIKETSWEWDHEGPTPFDASDFIVQDWDNYIKRHFDGDVSGEAHRKMTIDYIRQLDNGSNKEKTEISGMERLRLISDWSGDAFESLDNSTLATLTGLTEGSVKVSRHRLKAKAINNN